MRAPCKRCIGALPNTGLPRVGKGEGAPATCLPRVGKGEGAPNTGLPRVGKGEGAPNTGLPRVGIIDRPARAYQPAALPMAQFVG